MRGCLPSSVYVVPVTGAPWNVSVPLRCVPSEASVSFVGRALPAREMELDRPAGRRPARPAAPRAARRACAAPRRRTGFPPPTPAWTRPAPTASRRGGAGPAAARSPSPGPGHLRVAVCVDPQHRVRGAVRDPDRPARHACEHARDQQQPEHRNPLQTANSNASRPRIASARRGTRSRTAGTSSPASARAGSRSAPARAWSARSGCPRSTRSTRSR